VIYVTVPVAITFALMPFVLPRSTTFHPAFAVPVRSSRSIHTLLRLSLRCYVATFTLPILRFSFAFVCCCRTLRVVATLRLFQRFHCTHVWFPYVYYVYVDLLDPTFLFGVVLFIPRWFVCITTVYAVVVCGLPVGFVTHTHTAFHTLTLPPLRCARLGCSPALLMITPTALLDYGTTCSCALHRVTVALPRPHEPAFALLLPRCGCSYLVHARMPFLDPFCFPGYITTRYVAALHGTLLLLLRLFVTIVVLLLFPVIVVVTLLFPGVCHVVTGVVVVVTFTLVRCYVFVVVVVVDCIVVVDCCVVDCDLR